MNFLNELYIVRTESRTADGAVYTVGMNPEHVIYRAHFPLNPITPGVCILQMGLDLLARTVSCKLDLVRVKNMKFLSILRPDGNQVSVKVHGIVEEDGVLKAQVDLYTAEQVVSKMSLICRKTAK